MDRTFNTLFLLISVDGKISTGSVPERDVDKDYKNIIGVKEGLHQYYEIEKTTDIFSLNSGFVMSKIGVNTDKNPIHCPGVNFIIVDNNNLNTQGLTNLCNNVKTLFLVTTNKNHPAFKLRKKNLEIIHYEQEVDFDDMFIRLKTDHKAEKVTIQSGGTLNSIFLRKGLIDKVSVVVAPCLIGGKNTPSLVDGESLQTEFDLKDIKSLTLESVTQLDDNYLHIVYNVNN